MGTNTIQIPKNFTILYCPTCGKCQGYLLKKEGFCPTCKGELIELDRYE